MSWQGYVDNLVGNGLESAALMGLNGVMWAASENSLFAQADEASRAALVENFQKPSEFVKHGIHLGGKSFLFIRNSERTVLGKMQRSCVLIVRCNKCFVLGSCDQANLNHCSATMERLADYLLSVGF